MATAVNRISNMIEDKLYEAYLIHTDLRAMSLEVDFGSNVEEDFVGDHGLWNVDLRLAIQ